MSCLRLTQALSSLQKYFSSFESKAYLMSEGLSHVILNASSANAFDKALSFYCSVGFQIVSDSHDNDQDFTDKIAWLALFGDKKQKDLTLKLKLNPAFSPKAALCQDIDFTTQEVVLVIATANLQVNATDGYLIINDGNDNP
jgi:hypothetical protein